jgi:hypothetical protein
MLEASTKAFLVEGLNALPDAALAKKLHDKNALLTVAFDADAPMAVATRLMELKKLLGDSENLLLVNEATPLTPTDPAELRNFLQRIDAAKQQIYLKLIKAGWTKDEIYALTGVNPAPAAGQAPQMPPTRARFAGNLKKLG